MMRAIIAVALSLFLCITLGAKDMPKKKFIKWTPLISAPFNFPADGQWLYVRYGLDKAVTPYLGGAELLNSGITRHYPKTPTITFSVPSGADLLWASWTEGKWYVADIKFNRKEKAIIKNADLSVCPRRLCGPANIETISSSENTAHIMVSEPFITSISFSPHFLC